MGIRQRLAKLIDVKSIVTLCLVALFMVQTVRGVEISQTFLYLLTSVVTFYFARQSKTAEETRASLLSGQQSGSTDVSGVQPEDSQR